MSTSSERRRAYTGPTLLSHGFRPFFLFAGFWAALALTLWVTTLATGYSLPSRMFGVDWHIHEMVFGYSSAVIAGFLLTAIPNWTGRLPVVGWSVAGLVGLWAAGRLVVATSDFLHPLAVATIDVGFLVVFGAVIAREILAGKNWRNLKVLGLVLVLSIANGLFHWESYNGTAYDGYGVRLGIGTVIFLIMLIGGRVIPSFTRNWMVRNGGKTLPIASNGFDTAAMGFGGLAVIAWVAAPAFVGTLAICMIAAVLHTIRLARWFGWRAYKEPLVTVLHAAYLFIPLGFAMIALGDPSQIPHAWMVGAIGGMTIAMMTRVSLGHSGRALKSNAGIVAIYMAVFTAAVFRIASEVFPTVDTLLYISATAWIAGFLAFVVIYYPILAAPRK